MSMLECYEPSEIAWSVLERAADLFLDVSEAGGGRRHAHTREPRWRGPGAGDRRIRRRRARRSRGGGGRSPPCARVPGSGRDARVLLFGTEGATDPELYESLVGAALHA